jgi:hypothetical protein
VVSRRASGPPLASGHPRAVHQAPFSCCRASEHAYRDKERDERAAEEEDRSPVACATFLVRGGRGS